ncbi:MAG: hypothetical protein ACI9OJ_003980, partial [Myxococcota bacterium]
MNHRMKRARLKTALLSSALALSLLAAPGAFATAKPGTLTSTITAVTVFSDRAQITRTAKPTTDEGTSTWTFAGLPGWVDDGSVRVALKPANAGRILDVQVKRDF